MDILIPWVFNLSFSTFIGGYFLCTACWLYNEWKQGPARPRGIAGAPQYELKTTDAGPYTAPGVPTEPSEEKSPAISTEPIEEPPSFLVACGINFVVYWVAVIANFFLGIFLYGLGGGSPGRNIDMYFPWLAPLLTFFVALFLLTAMLRTTLLRSFLITLMLVVPWGAVGIALLAICMKPFY